jgi:hypothetical protein
MDTLTFEEVIKRIKSTYDARNVTFRFAGSSQPVPEVRVEAEARYLLEDEWKRLKLYARDPARVAFEFSTRTLKWWTPRQ